MRGEQLRGGFRRVPRRVRGPGVRHPQLGVAKGISVFHRTRSGTDVAVSRGVQAPGSHGDAAEPGGGRGARARHHAVVRGCRRSHGRRRDTVRRGARRRRSAVARSAPRRRARRARAVTAPVRACVDRLPSVLAVFGSDRAPTERGARRRAGHAEIPRQRVRRSAHRVRASAKTSGWGAGCESAPRRRSR